MKKKSTQKSNQPQQNLPRSKQNIDALHHEGDMSMESKKRIIQIVTPATAVFAMYKNRDADGSDWRQPGQITLWALIEYKNGSRGVEGLLAEEYGIEEAEMYGDFAGYYNAEEVEDMISFTPAPDAPLKNKKPAMSVFQFPAPDVDQ